MLKSTGFTFPASGGPNFRGTTRGSAHSRWTTPTRSGLGIGEWGMNIRENKRGIGMYSSAVIVVIPTPKKSFHFSPRIFPAGWLVWLVGFTIHFWSEEMCFREVLAFNLSESGLIVSG